MMYSVYVIQSLKNGKRYVGFTADAVETRLQEHHNGANQWTSQNGPFKIIHIEELPDRFSAVRREKFLKSGHGREVLKRFIPR